MELNDAAVDSVVLVCLAFVSQLHKPNPVISALLLACLVTVKSANTKRILLKAVEAYEDAEFFFYHFLKLFSYMSKYNPRFRSLILRIDGHTSSPET